MRGQVAFEYMIIVAVVFAFLIPIWAYINLVQTRTNAELTLSYAKNVVEKITMAADLVYSQGPPARVKLKLYIPNNVQESTISNKTVIMGVMTDSGISDVYSTSMAALNGTIPTIEGNYWAILEAKENYVQITII
jgi:uncharacterized protein (UPF0333 family)